jgi:Cu-Zn family superoxide dismutase
MIKLQNFLKAAVFLFVANLAYASTVIHIYSTDQKRQRLGTVTATDTQNGLSLTPNLSGLSPGLHGFHVHQSPFCENGGMAAGGHLDPAHTDKHLGPYNDQGHLGDLPALFVDKEGRATLPVLAPRLKLADIQGHSLMIHAGGDNYSDNPKMGGGGARVACGVIP